MGIEEGGKDGRDGGTQPNSLLLIAVHLLPTPPPMLRRLLNALLALLTGQRPDQRPDQKLDHDGYAALRARANEQGDAMAKCFHESRQAYADGNGALAKELSNKGKQHQKRMEDLNKQASDWVFAGTLDSFLPPSPSPVWPRKQQSLLFTCPFPPWPEAISRTAGHMKSTCTDSMSTKPLLTRTSPSNRRVPEARPKFTSL
jgi:hypothetical protein